MWPSTFNKKSATISGWQALGDFAAVKQQLQKIRASTRISGKKDVGSRPLPPLPGAGGGNKSVRFSLPLGPQGQMVSGSEGSGSDQGYESDQSRERRRQLELPGLFSKLTNFRQKPIQAEEERSYGHMGTLTRQTGTLTRYHKDSDHMYYGPIKNLQESDRDMSSSSPVLLEMYDHVKVHPEGGKGSNVKAAMARLASTENLTNSYDLVFGLVRRPNPSPCRHSIPSTPPMSRHHHCHCHRNHHCSLPRDRRKDRDIQHPRSRPSSPSPVAREGTRARSRSRPTSPSPHQKQQSKSKWSFVKKAKRSASAERGERGHRHGPEVGPAVELGWSEVRPSVMGQWEDTGNNGWTNHCWTDKLSSDSHNAANTATLAADLCRRATALRRTLYKLPGLINQRNEFLEIIKDVASEMKLLLDSAGRLAPNLPERQRAELDMARRKLLETSRSFSNALKAYFKTPEATPVLLAATALVYRTDEIIQALEP